MSKLGRRPAVADPPEEMPSAYQRGYDNALALHGRAMEATERARMAAVARAEAAERERDEARAEIRKWEKLPGGWEAMKALSEEFNGQRGDLTNRLVAQRRTLRDLHARVGLLEEALRAATPPDPASVPQWGSPDWREWARTTRAALAGVETGGQGVAEDDG